jgi:hypothetical protein
LGYAFSGKLGGLVMTGCREQHVLRFPAWGATDDAPAAWLQGPQTLAEIAFVASYRTHQCVMTA